MNNPEKDYNTDTETKHTPETSSVNKPKKDYNADIGAKHAIETSSVGDKLIVIGSIVADATCFAMLLYFLSWHWAPAVLLGLLIAFIVDGGGYYFADVGIGNYLSFPKLWRVPDIAYDLKRAVGVMIAAGLVVTIALVSFSYLRWDQIQKEDQKLATYETYRQSEEYQSLTRDEQILWDRGNRPRYYNPNNRTFDMITLIVPILTTLFSIGAGVFKDRKYDRYDKQSDFLDKEITREEKYWARKIEKRLEKYEEDKASADKAHAKQKDIANTKFKNERDAIDNQIKVKESEVNGYISRIIEIVNIGDDADILGIFKDREKNRAPYDKLRREVSRIAKKGARKSYRNHVATLVSDLRRLCGNILSIVREWADHPNDFTSHTLDAAVNRYRSDKYKIEDPSDPIKLIGEAYLKLIEENKDETPDDRQINALFTHLQENEGDTDEV